LQFLQIAALECCWYRILFGNICATIIATAVSDDVE
jgi:hypothetical protein